MKIRLTPKRARKDAPHKTVKQHLAGFLQKFGVRPTRQRLDLSALLFDGQHKHVTAEELLSVARSKKIRVSLATIYNSLNHFVKVGMLQETSMGAGKTYFDTNTDLHHHFFDEESGRLWDIPASAVKVDYSAAAPEGLAVDRVSVTIRLHKDNN